ncbi:hypothetical protein CEUSTIGMA_g4595.t1 [Chlamydomonas eustigma]|uniref:cellulase n=1 Tax=Chlamydomonas eustigma TaxID=1157962 RepID=A0A250X2I5_9CHLO|nr:hypothetical protein CEUSTIGMA_g4595.t1 [Chlamydomonas eustigma]|eukprot:GAX77149.1 hypothetical protein CEUSTIGMA_g4595.t1 [Chlamydomonas eustigma]
MALSQCFSSQRQEDGGTFVGRREMSNKTGSQQDRSNGMTVMSQNPVVPAAVQGVNPAYNGSSAFQLIEQGNPVYSMTAYQSRVVQSSFMSPMSSHSGASIDSPSDNHEQGAAARRLNLVSDSFLANNNRSRLNNITDPNYLPANAYSDTANTHADQVVTPHTEKMGRGGEIVPTGLVKRRVSDSTNTDIYDTYVTYDDDRYIEDLQEEGEDNDDEEAPLKPKIQRKPCIVHRWNIIPCLLFFWFLGASAYYYYVRWGMLTNAYAIFVYCVEILGWTSFAPYAILITRGVYATGSPGLPPAGSAEADEQAVWWTSPTKVRHGKGASKGDRNMTRGLITGGPFSPATEALADTSYFMYRFHVRVLIPCYKEDLAVIASTVQAALSADLPALTRRTVYMLDDGKDLEKKSFIEGLRMSGEDVVYVSGRIRKKGEVNGKSGNLNNALRNVIYKNYPKNELGEIDWTEISNKECIVVFDADMNCKPDFFLKMLEVMVDDNISLTLSPQAFYNIDVDADIFNAINAQFWEYWLPGAFGWGYIACTGTNFMIRARALCHCGFFPDYTITEDYALGMELKSRGYKATYLNQYIAVGEAPEEARNIFQQRSRWTKGHYQVYFSGINPLMNFDLPFFQRLWYTYAAWAPFCTIITVPSFMVVPFMSIVFGYNPVSITFDFVLASTLYFVALQAIQNYCTSWSHLKLMWYVNVSNTVLWFTYLKAFVNTLALKAGMKIVVFKVTAKTKTADPAPPPVEVSPAPLLPYTPPVLALEAAASTPVTAPTTMVGRLMSNLSARLTPRKQQVSITVDSTPQKNAFTAVNNNESGVPATPGYQEAPPAVPPPPPPLPPSKSLTGWERVCAIARHFKPANITEFGRMMDPLALLFMWCFNIGVFSIGIWQLTLAAKVNTTTGFQLNSPLSGNPYIIISTVWALYNSISPYLFLHYCVTCGRSFRLMVRCLMVFSTSILLGSMAIIWLLIPASFNVQDVVTLANQNFYSNSIATDTNTNFQFVVGTAGTPVESAYLQNINRNLLDTSKPLLDLTGGLLVTDHVKYGMPMAYSITMMAWAYLQFPNGAADSSSSLLNVIREGADYLMRCYITLPDGSSVFVAQVGDGADYAVLAHNGYDPVAQGKVWTSPQQDPFLAGNLTRKVWLMTADHVGADLLADAAGALAATSMVFKNIDATFSARALLTAQKVYQFATLTSNNPSSYCNFVPCTTNVTYNKQVMAKQYVAPPPAAPVCYYLDWVAQTCYISRSESECTTIALRQKEVYTNREACCNAMTNSGLWAGLPSKAQGICAVPANHYYCYIPDTSIRSCLKYTIDNQTGVGCTGQGLSVYPDPQVCCNALATEGIIDSANNLPGTGTCARINLDPGFNQCYVPVLNNATCVVLNGSACAAYGIANSFDSAAGCCNNMITTMQNLGFNKAGGIQLTTAGLCSLYYNPASGPPTRRRGMMTTISKSLGSAMRTISSLVGFKFEAPSVGVADNVMIDHYTEEGGQLVYTSSSAAELRSSILASDGVEIVDADNKVEDDSAWFSLKGGRNLLQSSPALSPASTITIGFGSSPSVESSSSSTNLIAIANSSYWHPPVTLAVEQCADNACSFILVEDIAEVEFFNSTSVYDDLAWGAVWMYKATGNALYLGQSERFLATHYTTEATQAVLISDRSAYIPNWNNLDWYVNVLLASITGKQQYTSPLDLLMTTWEFGDSVNLDTPLPPATAIVNIAEITAITNVTDPSTNITWLIVPQCAPTSAFEDVCDDGIDNNCNGLTDDEDPNCGMFPVLYTPNKLAFSASPSIPNAANVAFLAMMYAEISDSSIQRNLRCWALDQVAYMIGSKIGQPSSVVGYTDIYPIIIQQRASSCPTVLIQNINSTILEMLKQTDMTLFPNASQVNAQTASSSTQNLLQEHDVPTNLPPCSWDNAYYPATPNPQLDLVKGALIAGPQSYYPFVDADTYSNVRTSESTHVTLHGNVGFTGAAMALTSTQTTIRTCEPLHGLYQKYTTSGQL